MELKLLIYSLVLTSLLSAFGASFLLLAKENRKSLSEYMLSLSAGTIFGGVFIHLVFKLANKIGYSRNTGLLVLAGVVVSLLLERAVHWHCHHREIHVEPFSFVLLAGDAIHNILDGILIATSFLVGSSAGLAATVAIIMHKVPKEAGDFGVLIHSGFTERKAILFNVAISGFMFVGAGLVWATSTYIGEANTLLLPLVIGNFVYIAGSDLLPRFKHSEKHLAIHIAMFTLGVAIMYVIPFVKAAVLG